MDLRMSRTHRELIQEQCDKAPGQKVIQLYTYQVFIDHYKDFHSSTLV